jgi:TatD DNase family protein
VILSYARGVIDTHCHLDTPAFDADRDDVVARANAAGVIGMLVPAIRPNMWSALVAFSAKHHDAGVRCAIGVHPQVVPALAADERAGDLADRIEAAATDAIAIGECGLDGATGDREQQEAIFRAHIRAARAVGKPLVVHVLRAHDAAPRILREERAHEVGGVMHSYSGGADLVRVYRDLGMAFSFAGPVTYANARKPLEAVRAIPSELLLAETDAPDQSPVPHLGQRCEPAFVRHVLAGLANARAEPVEETIRLTSANARRIFRTW